MGHKKTTRKATLDSLRYWAFMIDEAQQNEIVDQLQQEEYLSTMRQEKAQKHLSEGWEAEWKHSFRGDEGVTCEICGVEFENFRQLNGHMNAHRRDLRKIIATDESLFRADEEEEKEEKPKKKTAKDRRKETEALLAWAKKQDWAAETFKDGTGCISKGSFPGMTCEYCGFDPHDLVYYQCKQNDEDLTWDEWKEELEFYFYEGSHSEHCQGLIDEMDAKEADYTIDMMNSHGIKWSGTIKEKKKSETFEASADDYGDLEYILLEVMTAAEVEEEYGDYMREHPQGPIDRDDLPWRLDDEYRTSEEAEYLRGKYLKEIKESESFKEWADEELNDHGDISFDDWAEEEYDEPAHSHHLLLSFQEWADEEKREAAHQHAEEYHQDLHLRLILIQELIDKENQFQDLFQEEELWLDEVNDDYISFVSNWPHPEFSPEEEQQLVDLIQKVISENNFYNPRKGHRNIYLAQGPVFMDSEGRDVSERMTREEAEELAAKVVEMVTPDVDFVEVCGSFRRGRQDPGDLDVVVILKEGITLPEMIEKNKEKLDVVNWMGEKKAQTEIDGHKVDFRTTSTTGKGAALLYFTGPAGYNIGMRRRAKKMGMKLNEYGIWDRETNEYLGGATEQEIYEVLGKSYKSPTERKGAEDIVRFQADDFMDEEIPAGKYIVEWTGGREEFEWDGGPAMSFNDVWTDILWNDSNITVWDSDKSKVFGAVALLGSTQKEFRGEPLGADGW